MGSSVNLSIGLPLFQQQGNLLPYVRGLQRPAVDEEEQSSRKPMESLYLWGNLPIKSFHTFKKMYKILQISFKNVPNKLPIDFIVGMKQQVSKHNCFFEVLSKFIRDDLLFGKSFKLSAVDIAGESSSVDKIWLAIPTQSWTDRSSFKAMISWVSISWSKFSMVSGFLDSIQTLTKAFQLCFYDDGIH